MVQAITFNAQAYGPYAQFSKINDKDYGPFSSIREAIVAISEDFVPKPSQQQIEWLIDRFEYEPNPMTEFTRDGTRWFRVS